MGPWLRGTAGSSPRSPCEQGHGRMLPGRWGSRQRRGRWQRAGLEHRWQQPADGWGAGRGWRQAALQASRGQQRQPAGSWLLGWQCASLALQRRARLCALLQTSTARACRRPLLWCHRQRQLPTAGFCGWQYCGSAGSAHRGAVPEAGAGGGGSRGGLLHRRGVCCGVHQQCAAGISSHTHSGSV